MNIADVINVLEKAPFFYSRMHDYDLGDDHISMLGLFAEEAEYLRIFINPEWEFVERRRNPDNDFLRINIVKKEED